MLKFQLQEIEEANIYVGEEEQQVKKKNTAYSKNPNGTSNSSCCSWREVKKAVDAIGRSYSWSRKPRIDFNKL